MINLEQCYKTNVWKTGFCMMSAGAIAEYLSTLLKQNIRAISHNESTQLWVLELSHLLGAPLFAGSLVYWMNLYVQKHPNNFLSEAKLDEESTTHRWQLSGIIFSLELTRLLRLFMFDVSKQFNDVHELPSRLLYSKSHFIEFSGTFMIGLGLMTGITVLRLYRDQHVNASLKSQMAIFFSAMCLGVTMSLQFHSHETSHLGPFIITTPLMLIVWKLFHTDSDQPHQEQRISNA